MVKRGLILGGLLALFGGAFAYAEGADLSIDVKSASLQLTVPENINIELQPTSSAAVFDSRDLTFNVATNNPTGYTVTMSVPQTAMPHSSLASTTLPTLESTTTEANFPANKWGYKTTGDYNPVALTNTDSAWNFDGPTNSQNHTVTLGAKVDSLQPAGIYETTITFTAVANPNSPRLTVSFDGNGADSGTMNPILLYGGDTATISSNTFSKASYSFNGWNTEAHAAGQGYGNGDTITAPILTEPKTITLYAQWTENSGGSGGSGGGSSVAGRTLERAFEEAYLYNNGNLDGYKGMYVPEKDNLGNFTGVYHEATSSSEYNGIAARDLRYGMQDINLLVDGENVCDRTTVIGSEAYVLDLRDFKSYHIIKMRDGRCWMQDNIALNPTDSTTRTRMATYNYTNATDEAVDNYLNGGNPNNRDGWSNVAAYYSADNGLTYTGSERSREFIAPRFNLDRANSVSSSAKDIKNGWVAGGYYNYCGASAGTFCYHDGNGSTTGAPDNPNSPIDSPYDICPSGWRMPTASDSTFSSDYKGETYSMYYSYHFSNDEPNDEQYITDLFHPAMNGYLQSGFAGQGGRTNYWTSTWTTAMGMKTMYISVNNNTGKYIYSQSGAHRAMGFSVRCIARITTEQQP